MRLYMRVFSLCGILLLSGCTFGSSTEEELTEVLTKMNEAEEIYRDGQHELNEVEQAEQELFSVIMELTQEETEALKKKVAEIGALLEQRLVLIDEEESSIKEAMKSVDSLDSIIDKADENIKGELEDIRETANARYEIHEAFVSAYKQLTADQKELYNMLVDEQVDLAMLENQVGKVNEQNAKVKGLIEGFNAATADLNDLKKQTFSIFKKRDD